MDDRQTDRQRKNETHQTNDGTETAKIIGLTILQSTKRSAKAP